MPEGDTLHRTAARLRPALEGRTLVDVDLPRLARARWPRVGRRIRAVEATGKHLVVAFDDGRSVQTHLGMTGSWHLVPTGGRSPKPPHLLRVRLDVEGWSARCFSAPTVRVVDGARALDDALAHLGPDLCRPDADLTEVARRIAAQPPDRPVLDVLLDQRVAAGIGNVYKSEVLWACRVHPLTPIAAVADPVALVETAARLLRANLGPGPRRTVAGGLAVYGRRGSPCRRCGTAVRSARLGEHARGTYWCPTCQPAP